MDYEIIYCPLTKDECLNDSCGLYSCARGDCSITVIADVLNEIYKIADDEKKERNSYGA